MSDVFSAVDAHAIRKIVFQCFQKDMEPMLPWGLGLELLEWFGLLLLEIIGLD